MTKVEKKHVILSAFNDCFVKCGGCYNFFGHKKEIVSTDKIIDFLRQLDKNEIEKVTVSGGEPLARPDIVALLQKIHALGFKINLDTVGTAFIDLAVTLKDKCVAPQVALKDIAPFVNMIGIPLDGSNDAVIKTFRHGRKNLFLEQIKVLDTAEQTTETPVRLCINTVVHQQNIADLKRIADILLGYRCIKEWQLFEFMPIGPLGFLNKDKYAITNKAYNEAFKDLKAYVDEKGGSLKLTKKTKKKRKKLYVLVDTDGNAWMPDYEKMSIGREKDTTSKRKIIGNILNQADIEKIILTIKGNG